MVSVAGSVTIPCGGAVAGASSRGSLLWPDACSGRSILAEEQGRLVRQVLERVPADYRQVMMLWYQEERSFEEIGQLLGRTIGAVRMVWWRTIKQFKSELEALL